MRLFVSCLLLSSTLLVNPLCAKAKYVFLFVGDGMGLAQRTLAEFVANSEVNDKPGIQRLRMNKLPVQTFMHTYNTVSYITDSAAAATTFAIGKKTYSGSIGLDGDGSKDSPNLLDIAKANGLKTGIITNVALNHATPASFYAREPSRNLYNKIADSLVASDLDFVGGGCIRTSKPGTKKPGDYYEIAKKNGFTFHSSNPGEFKPKAKERDWIMPEDCTSYGDIPYAVDRKDDKPVVLSDYVEMATRSLTNSKGFFLMVEDGKIDWACHSNDAATAALQVLDFDAAVKVAYDFYQRHPEETTIIVTADHETGGLTLGRTETKYEMHPGHLLKQKISMYELNQVIKGWRETKPSFDDVLMAVHEYFQIGDFEKESLDKIRNAYNYTFDPALKDKVPQKFLYSSSEPISITMIELLAEMSGVAWTTVLHTGVPVPLSAIGVGQEKFQGMLENTQVFDGLKAVIEAK